MALAQRHAREMDHLPEVGVPRIWSQQARQYAGVDFWFDAIEFSPRLPAPSLKIGRQHRCFSLRQVSADGGNTNIGSLDLHHRTPYIFFQLGSDSETS